MLRDREHFADCLMILEPQLVTCGIEDMKVRDFLNLFAFHSDSKLWVFTVFTVFCFEKKQQQPFFVFSLPLSSICQKIWAGNRWLHGGVAPMIPDGSDDCVAFYGCSNPQRCYPVVNYIFKRLRATAGQGPNYVAHFVAMLAYVGLSCGQCGPILWLCWPMLASGWFMLSQKIRKMGTAKKHCKTQDILMVGGLSWGYVGPSWGCVGLSWGQCGPILGLCWPILGLCWPILGLCWPILGLCWPILGLCWPILGAMLANLEAHVGPCWPILSHKIRNMGKNGKSTKHRKTR